jgi:hypothetical protein
VPELSAESATSKQGRLERKMELEQVDAWCEELIQMSVCFE